MTKCEMHHEKNAKKQQKMMFTQQLDIEDKWALEINTIILD